MVAPVEGKPLESWRIRQIEEEIRQREKRLWESRNETDDENLSPPEAWLLIIAGALGVGGTGHISTLEFQMLLRTEEMQLMDPGVGIALAVQRGLQGLGSWAPPSAFGLGFLLLLVFVLRPSLRNGESSDLPIADWRAWVLALGLIVIPFFDFATVGDVMGLPIGIGVSCGLYGIGLGLRKSEALREMFRYFSGAWFGILLVLATVGLMIGGFVLSSPAVVLPGVLIASCFSLHLISIGLEKRAKVRGWEQERSQIEQMKTKLEGMRKEEGIERELREILSGEWKK